MGAVPSPEILDMRMYENTRCIESQLQYSNKILFQRKMYQALEKQKQSIRLNIILKDFSNRSYSEKEMNPIIDEISGKERELWEKQKKK